MGRRIAVTLIAAVLAAGLAGCGAKEREELKQKVATLEQQVAKVSSQLAEKDAALASMEQSIKQAHDEVAKCTTERDMLKAQVSKKKAAPTKATTTKKK